MPQTFSTRLASVLFVFVATALCSSQAFAQSDKHGVFEFRLGGYYPAIDNEFGDGAGPFETFFGTSSLWMGELEVDFYLLQGFGTLGLGMHAGYASTTGSVRNRDAIDEALPDTTTFRVIPLRASAVYRYDYSALNHGIPLVPVFKAGLDYYLWSIEGADGETAISNGNNASGGRAGWHASLGLHFLLDVVDPSSAAAFDLNWGINHSYLFVEYMMTRIDGFGSTGFDLSDDQWMFGLAFEF
ncbi:MAG: hypothetical protein H0U74_21425 [Bradymonadaceae bacterium]|nr:hypothetical protein [Lujinxingiaceae bacterium]